MCFAITPKTHSQAYTPKCVLTCMHQVLPRSQRQIKWARSDACDEDNTALDIYVFFKNTFPPSHSPVCPLHLPNRIEMTSLYFISPNKSIYPL